MIVQCTFLVFFTVLFCNNLNPKHKKTNFDFCPCSEEEDQGELGAEEEEEIDVDSSVDVPQATGGYFFFSLPKSSPLTGTIYSSL